MDLVPVEAEPLDIRFDRFHKLRLFLGRIRVVEKQIALSVVFFSRTEIQAKRFRVPDVQIAVRFRGKTGMNFRDLPFGKLFVYNVFDKVVRFFLFRFRSRYFFGFHNFCSVSKIYFLYFSINETNYQLFLSDFYPFA